MAMTLRLPEDVEKELDAIAAADGVSKHSLLVEGARVLVEQRKRRALIDEAVDYVDQHHGDVIDRLSKT
ncbi:hypothetical protein [Nesterenkonia alba]|uniref:hypothetical protein n=1 Tax=Nesterenkonia alba TaxID=515814 RepID=UPI0012EC7E72|nr:hypothetical protein [Nesterenkonia alba]